MEGRLVLAGCEVDGLNDFVNLVVLLTKVVEGLVPWELTDNVLEKMILN